MKKTGKVVKLNIDKNFKTKYGTVDSKQLDTIYFELNTWAQPLEIMDWSAIERKLKRGILLSINDNIDSTFFYSKNIVDIDLHTSRMEKNKKSYLTINVTLFTKENFNFYNEVLSENIQRLLYKTIDYLQTIDGFNYSLKK